MERGIAGVVQALNHLGVETVGSCQGHPGAPGRDPEAWIVCQHGDLHHVAQVLQKAFHAISLDEIVVMLMFIPTESSASPHPSVIVLRNFSRLGEVNQERVASAIQKFMSP